MIGIYKIQNLSNGKIYIGQSNNIERRFREHKNKGEISRIPLDIAIKKYGVDAFSYEIIEECSLADLNEREMYWIRYYNSIELGYNCSNGGDSQTIGENNGRAILSNLDIIKIRTAYSERKTRISVYQDYMDRISFNTFARVWDGTSWSHIMPEVYTLENKKYYIQQTQIGEKSVKAILTDDEVIQFRSRYQNETAISMYMDIKDKISFQTFQSILWGRSYKHLPIYKKKEKKWIYEY